MTRTVLIKRTSLYPKLIARLRDSDGSAVDLSTADSVTFTMRRLDDDTVVVSAGACTVLDDAQGIVQYAWESGDTDATGAHVGDFEITWSPGDTEIIPTKGYVTIRILQAAADV